MKTLILMTLLTGLISSCASLPDDPHTFTVVVEREVYTCTQQDSGEYSCEQPGGKRNSEPVEYQPGERL